MIITRVPEALDRSGAKNEPLEPGIGLETIKRQYPLGITFSCSERETGIEPATFSLARRRSTTEPLALIMHTIVRVVHNANKSILDVF